jgi:enterochelin esterase-like enzyme
MFLSLTRKSREGVTADGGAGPWRRDRAWLPLPRLSLGRTIPILGAALVLGVAPPPAIAQAEIAHGTVVQIELPSAALHGTRKTMVYLPPGYDDPANASQRYPVLYLLSGAPGSQKDWFQHGQAGQIVDRLIAARAIPPVILVSPDGNGGAYRDTQFIDSFDGRERVETFISHDLLTYIDTFYRTIPAARGRALLGYSAGAYGAVNIGLHYPDRFGALAGFCGYYTPNPSEVAYPMLNNPFGRDRAVLAYNDPSRTVLALPPDRRPRIFLFDTTNDGSYTRATSAFDGLLSRLHYPHLTRLYVPGTATERATWPHSWVFVRRAFTDYLPAIVDALAGGAP